jgi:hypothetical protein
MEPQMTGYDTEDRYFASRFKQGERIVYSIDLSLAHVAATLPRPDPNRPTPGNRRVRDSHARGFGKYVLENETWIAPALLLRAPDIFTFKMQQQVDGMQFGILSVPRLARTELGILDGQHRILGIYYATEEVATQLQDVRNHLAAARRQQDPDLEAHFQTRLVELEQRRNRLSREHISVQIHIEEELTAFEQMFFDIAENALGIQNALRVRFDNRKVVNRALEDALRHSLLTERVDLEQDRVGGASPYLLGAKHVADIVRTVTVGISGRVGRRQETELNEAELVENTNRFLDTLVEAFPDLDHLLEGRITPQDLRNSSLLGSATMLRVLAGVYYELANKHSMSDDEIQEFFSKLAPFMSAPVKQGSPWMEAKVFSEGAMAPQARGGNLRALTDITVRWAKHTPKWLSASQAS